LLTFRISSVAVNFKLVCTHPSPHLPSLRVMYVNKTLPCFYFISVWVLPSRAEASSCRVAHLGVGPHHFEVAPASRSTDSLAHHPGCPSGRLHVLQTYQQLSVTPHRRRAAGKVACCSRTQRVVYCVYSFLIRWFVSTYIGDG
jgi:hypothetical protein